MGEGYAHPRTSYIIDYFTFDTDPHGFERFFDLLERPCAHYMLVLCGCAGFRTVVILTLHDRGRVCVRVVVLIGAQRHVVERSIRPM